MSNRGGACLQSSGGIIANGTPSPSLGDARVRNFVVNGGRIDVLYDPIGLQFAVPTEGAASVTVLPTQPSGAISGNRALAATPVRLTSLDTAHAPRSQSSVIADGQQRIVTVDMQDFRDSAGNSVPDVKIAVSTLDWLQPDQSRWRLPPTERRRDCQWRRIARARRSSPSHLHHSRRSRRGAVPDGRRGDGRRTGWDGAGERAACPRERANASATGRSRTRRSRSRAPLPSKPT